MNEMVYQMQRIFPDPSAQNRMICVNGIGSRTGTTTLMVDKPIDLNSFDAGAQCFPLYLYDLESDAAPERIATNLCLFSTSAEVKNSRGCRNAITDEGLAYFQKAYPSQNITREDLFYYIYGILHSLDYRKFYADTLHKELPRIPCVRTAEAFRAFSDAGRDLGDIHAGYERVALYAAVDIQVGPAPLLAADYRVTQMRYGKKGREKDRTILHYNEKITVTNIPLEAYDYVVNGKSALDWVVERQCVRTDKASGLVNDANTWAIETMGDPRYPLDLFLRVITVSMKTLEIVRSLPALDIMEAEAMGANSGKRGRFPGTQVQQNKPLDG